MESELLFNVLKNYFTHNPELMRHLKVNACWEYIITKHSLDEEIPKLHFYLFKKSEQILEIIKQSQEIPPDLTLFFTEDAILNLIHNNPSAEEYYNRYRRAMNTKSGLQVDNKVNKPRLKLFKLGYQKWQKDFKF